MKNSKNIILLAIVVFALGLVASITTASEVETSSFVGNLLFLLPGLALLFYGLSLKNKEKE